MKFNYQARTKTGEVRFGTIEASSREAAAVLLQRHGLIATFLEEISSQPFWARKIKFFARVSRKEIVMFSRQLAIMFKSQVPLVEGLFVLSTQFQHPVFREKLAKISEDVRGGISLSQALSYHPEVFSSFYVSMVKAGEASGTLSQSLEYLADHLERDYDLSRKIRGAMIYPIFIIAVMIAVLLIMLLFVVPQMGALLEETGQELPFITKMVLGVSDLVRKWGWSLLIGVVILAIIIFRYLRSSRGKGRFDEKLLGIPLIGSFLKMVYLARFAENLSVLIAGGLPISQALEITGYIVDNQIYQRAIFTVRDEVRKGGMISSLLSKDPELFPPMFSQMVLVGEKTGTLDKSLMNIVSFYEKEIDRMIELFLGLLEPIMLLFLGVVVAGVVAAIMLPLYNLASF